MDMKPCIQIAPNEFEAVCINQVCSKISNDYDVFPLMEYLLM